MPLMKANPGSKTRRVHWSQGANGSQRTRWQEDGKSRQGARAAWSSHRVSPYLYIECLTASLSMKLWKRISVVNEINNRTVQIRGRNHWGEFRGGFPRGGGSWVGSWTGSWNLLRGKLGRKWGWGEVKLRAWRDGDSGQLPLRSRELWKTSLEMSESTVTEVVCVMLRNINFLMQPIEGGHYVRFR